MVTRPHTCRQRATYALQCPFIQYKTIWCICFYCTLSRVVTGENTICLFPVRCFSPSLCGIFFFFSSLGVKLMLADAVWSILSLAQMHLDRQTHREDTLTLTLQRHWSKMRQPLNWRLSWTQHAINMKQHGNQVESKRAECSQYIPHF